MKYLSKILFITCMSLGIAACSEGVGIYEPDTPESTEVPVNITMALPQISPQELATKSMVSGTENNVHSIQMICFDANGLYLGIRNADIVSQATTTPKVDKGLVKGTVPQGTARIHFIANRDLTIPLSHNVGTAEDIVMNSLELSTIYNDTDHQEVCYWGYHKESTAAAMHSWLNPTTPNSSIVYLIRDRAKVVFTYDPTGASVPVTKIEWLIHNGRERGFLAPAKESWGNDAYYTHSSSAGHTSEYVSTAKMNECTLGGNKRYTLYDDAVEPKIDHDGDFDLAYQSTGTGTYTAEPQFLFDDDNADIDNVKVILKVTYTVNGSSKTVYHVLRLNDNDGNKYDIVRNNTYYINAKLLSPDIAFYETLKEAIGGTEFMNADVEVDREIPDINNDQYTLQIKLKTETTSVVLNTEGEHKLDFVFRSVSDINTTGSTEPTDFEISWEKAQTFCSPTLGLTYEPATKQFHITATVLEGQLSDHLQDEWIVVKHKASGLTRYIHVFVIDQFKFETYPKLTSVGSTGDYMLSFKLPSTEHKRFLPDGSPDPSELIYPTSLYPIDVKFTTNTLNAYGISQGVKNYGLFGVSVEDTGKLTNSANFEDGYNNPVSSTNYNADRTHWYFQQQDNFWDFWYTYSLKSYADTDNGEVKIYFKDVRSNIKYATVSDVGLFLHIEYFGMNYSIPVSTQ